MKYIKKINENTDNSIDIDYIKQETFILNDLKTDNIINSLYYEYNKISEIVYIHLFQLTSSNIIIDDLLSLLTELKHLKEKFENDGFSFQIDNTYTNNNGIIYNIIIKKRSKRSKR